MTLADRCLAIETLILDVDGVLTNGAITYLAGGQEIKEFHVRDGSAIKQWQQAGKSLAILSGRSSEVTSRRAHELGIVHVQQGNADKMPGYLQLLETLGQPQLAVAYLGDDHADVPILMACRLAIAVADACPRAQQVAHYVTRASGGAGAVSESIQLILRSQQRWPASGGQ